MDECLQRLPMKSHIKDKKTASEEIQADSWESRNSCRGNKERHWECSYDWIRDYCGSTQVVAYVQIPCNRSLAIFARPSKGMKCICRSSDCPKTYKVIPRPGSDSDAFLFRFELFGHSWPFSSPCLPWQTPAPLWIKAELPQIPERSQWEASGGSAVKSVTGAADYLIHYHFGKHICDWREAHKHKETGNQNRSTSQAVFH